MLGGFYCPYCLKCNACDCESCKPHIKDADFVVKHTEDSEALICANCGKAYSYDDALETEHKILNHPL